MFKKSFCILLVWLLVLSMTACGAASSETVAVETVIQAEIPETVVQETTEAPTEPTLSEEELLIASLPEKVRQAYDLGLVDLELLRDLDRVCLGAEAAQIVQNIHVRHHSVESKIMNQLLESDHAGIEVTRYWLAQTMFAAEAEFIEEAPYEDYLENIKYMVAAIEKDMGFNDLYAYFINADGWVLHINNVRDWWKYDRYEHDAIISAGSSFYSDLEEMFLKPELAQEQELYVNCGDNWLAAVEWVTYAYDRLTGEKIMAANEWEPFRPREKMTVQEVVETTLRYHNWIPPLPEMLPYDQVPTYDSNIITDDLLTRETTLPEASCQELPASWRGVSTRTLLAPEEQDALTDQMLQENEIQVIADAGFNFLRIHLDFRYFVSDQYSIYQWPNEAEEGSMNESRLKELDQIIAWCMERDIHVNLICDGKIAGWSKQAIPPIIFSEPRNATPLAQQWQVLARRYAAIPNTYLSITMYTDPELWQPGKYGPFFTPVVEAIREVSPDRCIIAELTGRGDPGEDMAALGVALSTQAVWPEDFHFDREMKEAARNAMFETAAWPYVKDDEVYDAEAAMTNKQYNCDTPDAVAAVAEEYGVGFMVSGWAPTNKRTPVLRERYSDETMESYLADFAQVLADRGYGWCYGDANGFVGIFGAYPAVESTTYTQVGNAPLYIDDEMFNWFQALNNAQ